MDIAYPIGGGAPLKFAGPAEPASEPVTIIALCDGSVYSIAGMVEDRHVAGIERMNAAAGDRLVERIARRVTEMQRQTPVAMSADWAINAGQSFQTVRLRERACALGETRGKPSSVDVFAWDDPVSDGRARFGAVETVGTAHFADQDALEAGKPFTFSIDAKGADKGVQSAVRDAVQSAIAEYDEHLNQTLSRRIAQAEARGC